MRPGRPCSPCADQTPGRRGHARELDPARDTARHGRAALLMSRDLAPRAYLVITMPPSTAWLTCALGAPVCPV